MRIKIQKTMSQKISKGMERKNPDTVSISNPKWFDVLTTELFKRTIEFGYTSWIQG